MPRRNLQQHQIEKLRKLISPIFKYQVVKKINRENTKGVEQTEAKRPLNIRSVFIAPSSDGELKL